MTHLFYYHVICLGMHECQRIGFAPSVFTHHRVFLSDDMKDGWSLEGQVIDSFIDLDVAATSCGGFSGFTLCFLVESQLRPVG